jgi:hypothetical protein
VKKIFKYLIICLGVSPFVLVVFVLSTAVWIYFKNPEYMNKAALTNPFWGTINDTLESIFDPPENRRKQRAYKVGDLTFYLPKGGGVIYEPEKRIRFFLAMPNIKFASRKSIDIEVTSISKYKIGFSKHDMISDRLNSDLNILSISYTGPTEIGKFIHYERQWLRNTYGDIYLIKQSHKKSLYKDYIQCSRSNRNIPTVCKSSYNFLSPTVYYSFDFPYKELETFKKYGNDVQKFLTKVQTISSQDKGN